ncbi:hypothetical protein [Azorhizobium doebereinerae]|uniref:hypothetical protein n=1 Tax=Azorhizobium doebereinerae TaxID=281091 RepID=UPI00040505A2|nr:hypothetical protein [Azorhizobium doebereinerae]
MPLLVRFLMRHAAIGFGIAILFVGALLALDAQGLRSLLVAAPDGWLAAGVLTFAMGLTFSSVQMGAAVMLLTTRDNGPGGGRRIRLRAPGHLVPAPVRIRPSR